MKPPLKRYSIDILPRTYTVRTMTKMMIVKIVFIMLIVDEDKNHIESFARPTIVYAKQPLRAMAIEFTTVSIIGLVSNVTLLNNRSLSAFIKVPLPHYSLYFVYLNQKNESSQVLITDNSWKILNCTFVLMYEIEHKTRFKAKKSIFCKPIICFYKRISLDDVFLVRKK